MADLPLAGVRVVVTRPALQALPLAEALEHLGASVTGVPLVEIVPVEDAAALDAAGATLSRYDWIAFTSANGVRGFGDRLSVLDHSTRVAVVGRATADAVRAVGVEPAFVGEAAGEDIAAGLDRLDGARVLLLQADIAGGELERALRERGASVDVITAYRTVAREPTAAERATLGQADVIVLASGSAARSLVALEESGQEALLACIGPKTAQVAREVGLNVGVVAGEPTSEGIIRALVEHYGEST